MHSRGSADDTCKGHEYEGTTSGFGTPFRNYLDYHKPNVNGTGWVYDHAYHPWMVDQDWNLTGGEDYQGQFLADWLYDKRNDDQPNTEPAVSAIAVGKHRDPTSMIGWGRTEETPSVALRPGELAIDSDTPGALGIYGIDGMLLFRGDIGGPIRIPREHAGIVVVSFRRSDGVLYGWTAR